MASFRRSLSFGPLRVNLSTSGVALSAGVRGARVSVGPRGTYVSFGAGGFSYRVKLDETVRPANVSHGGDGSFGPHGSQGFIATAHVQALAQAAPDALVHDVETRARRVNLFKVYLWVSGVLLLFSLAAGSVFFVLLLLAGVGAFFVHRWDRERRTARIIYDIDNAEIVGRLALCNVAAEGLARAARLWHVFASTTTRDRKYHAGAGTLIQRTPTRCGLGSLDGVELNIDCWSVPVGPQQLLFLPDRLLVRQGAQHASIPYEWLTTIHETTKFIEDGYVPPDSQVVDTTWRFVNKSGGPDLRFNNNRRLPVVVYGELTLRSSTGLQIVIQSSNPLATQNACAALQELARIARAPVMPQPAYAPPAYIPSAPARIPPPAPPAAYGPPPAAYGFAPAGYGVPAQPRSPGSGRPPPLPPVVPILRPPRPHTAVLPASTQARFLGPSETLNVGGRMIARPLAYVSVAEARDTDASTNVTSLPVGDASRALPLPYWPTYAGADPDQRARYLDWMAGGRSDRNIAVGYAFIFFYGLERRVLIEGQDEDLARTEVRRLLDLFGESRSFRGYASDFLAFGPLRRVGEMGEADLADKFEQLLGESETALAAVVAWHQTHGRGLPAKYALHVVRGMEDAKRGAVVTRSAVELSDLFAIRYRNEFGDGLVLQAAKRALTIQYRPASGTLLQSGRPIAATLPDVLKRVGQFRKPVSIWNSCVEDLRKANSRKGGGKQLDAAAWTALPAELRAEYDHPDQDKWDATVAASPVLAGFHVAKAGALAGVVGLARAEKLTAAQMKRIAERAAEVGYVIEPEPRLRSKPSRWDDELMIWRSPVVGIPDPHVYGPVFAMLSLAMTVAMADGVFTQEEQDAVNSFLSEMFALDSDMRTRVEALKHLMARDPSRVGSVAKTLKETRTRDQLEKVARVLVAIAAADGTIAEAEEKALRVLYRNLGLPPGDLAATIAKTGARLERDVVVEAAPAIQGTKGVPIPRSPEEAPKFRLDQAAVDAIIADTKEVAAILAEVFDRAEEDVPSDRSPAVSAKVLPIELPRASEATAALAAALDVRYHAVLEELLQKEAWTAEEVRALATRHRLMPTAILDTVNTWSDEVLGDFIIEEAGEWKVNRELAKADA